MTLRWPQCNPYFLFPAVFTCFFWALFMETGHAEEMELPLKLQFKLLTTASTYNRSPHYVPPKTLRIGVVYSPESEPLTDEIVELFGSQKMNVRQFALQISPLLFKNLTQLKQETESEQINVFYVTPGNSDNLKSILRVSEELKILTTTGVRDYVYNGITLGVVNGGARPEFLFNRNAAQENGTDFNSNFLRMVKIVDY